MNFKLNLTKVRSQCLIVLLVVGFMGCVRVEADRKPPEPTRMIVTRDSQGVNMQFKSLEGLRYTVYYRDASVASNSWKPLPSATEIPGTGELILIRDQSRDAYNRKYRIQSLVPVNIKDLKK